MLGKKYVETIVDRLGLAVIPKWRFDKLQLSKRIQRIISEYKIDCIIDVGANIGQYHDFLRNHVGYTGLIISFEPDPSTFDVLFKNSQSDNLWIVHDYALGKENTTSTLNIMERSVFNSFFEPSHAEIDEFAMYNTVKAKTEVTVKRLDEVMPELVKKHQFKRAFLKLDTQGFDLDVFEGASDCLDIILGIQTEVSFIPIYQNIPSAEQSFSAFKSKGYEVSGLYAVDESRFPYAVEYDCIYLAKLGNSPSS